MKRVLEPELMTEEESVRAYAMADFEEPHSMIVAEVKRRFGDIDGAVLDLCCGPGDITFRLANAFPSCEVHGVDGSSLMLEWARDFLDDLPALEAQERVKFIEGYIPGIELPVAQYSLIFCNGSLHHLPDPEVLWEAVKKYGGEGTAVFVGDLFRPDTEVHAREIVEVNAADAPGVLKEDFYNSLLAAFEPGEIKEQLKDSGLEQLAVEVVSDRHVIVSGVI